MVGGIVYKIIHLMWLKRYGSEENDETVVSENEEETEKLAPEPKTRDAGTSMSGESLSWMLTYNQIGSLTSLSRSKVKYSNSFIYFNLNFLLRIQI